jgi:hypothetical protein
MVRSRHNCISIYVRCVCVYLQYPCSASVRWEIYKMTIYQWVSFTACVTYTLPSPAPHSSVLGIWPVAIGPPASGSPPMLDGSALLQHTMARFLVFANRLAAQASVNATTQSVASMLPARRTSGGLTRLAPYWVVYTTTAKGRWLGRTVLDVLSSEFRERSEGYYVRDSSFADDVSRTYDEVEMCHRCWCHDCEREIGTI